METVKNARRLAAVSDTARDLGLFEGQALADALALTPQLHTAEAEPEADLAALEALADWCVRFSPAVAADAPDGLILDIGGAAHLWGGERAMLDDLLSRLAHAGVPARAALADTAGAAWAFARYGGEDRTVIAPGATRAALTGLPIEGLRLNPAIADNLIVLGLTSIGILAAMPRGELSRRFGPSVRLRLDQALGEAREALVYHRAPTPFFQRLAFFEPISAPEDMERVTFDVVAATCAQLIAARRGARAFTLGFHRLDGRVEMLRVGTARASRDAKRIAKLFAPKLETVDPGFGVEAVTLRADAVEVVRERQNEIAEPPPRRAEPQSVPVSSDNVVPLRRPVTPATAAPIPAPSGRETLSPDGAAAPPEALVDQLANRLGEDEVWRASPFESWLPERAVARLAPLSDTQAAAWPPDRPRPVRLFRRPHPIITIAKLPDDPPRVFQWRGRTHQVRRAEGPERFAQEWWRAPFKKVGVEKVRDYYRIEDEDGRRFWIFRAGLYGPQSTTRWWLHGLFA